MPAAFRANSKRYLANCQVPAFFMILYSLIQTLSIMISAPYRNDPLAQHVETDLFFHTLWQEIEYHSVKAWESKYRVLTILNPVIVYNTIKSNPILLYILICFIKRNMACAIFAMKSMIMMNVSGSISIFTPLFHWCWSATCMQLQRRMWSSTNILLQTLRCSFVISPFYLFLICNTSTYTFYWPSLDGVGTWQLAM